MTRQRLIPCQKIRYGRFIDGEAVVFLYEAAVIEKTDERHGAVGEGDELEGIYPVERKMKPLSVFVEKERNRFGHIDILLHEKAENGFFGDIIAANDAGHFRCTVPTMLAVDGIETDGLAPGTYSGAVGVWPELVYIQFIGFAASPAEPAVRRIYYQDCQRRNE